MTQDEEITPVEYDYRDKGALLQDGEMWLARGEQAGLSVFVRRADSVHHTYSAYGDGTDLLLGTDNLALTPQGRPLPGEKGKWLRHHDRYEP
ncbi:DUF899 family protein [Streptomyces tendae]|uniref:DUF899 family protein n=1 Tax=Streptomyces tendae TaxID=1932 RepID=UPI0033FF5E0C